MTKPLNNKTYGASGGLCRPRNVSKSSYETDTSLLKRMWIRGSRLELERPPATWRPVELGGCGRPGACDSWLNLEMVPYTSIVYVSTLDSLRRRTDGRMARGQAGVD